MTEQLDRKELTLLTLLRKKKIHIIMTKNHHHGANIENHEWVHDK